MTEQTKETRGMFDELKAFISNLIKPEPKEGEEAPAVEETIMVAPAELTAKVEAFQVALDAIETNEEAVAQLETLKSEQVEFEKTITDLKADNKTQAEKVLELEGKLTKLNGGSTTVEGTEGMEDPDTSNIAPEQKALKNDLANLRAELVTVHN